MSGRTLFERLSEDPRVLEKAWREVNRNARSLSYGTDNIRLDEFSAHAQRHLASLRLSIKDGTFNFQDLRAAAIPKSNGKYRPLQIATIQDRIVQKAIELLIRKKLNDKYNLFNNPVSYAFIRTEDVVGYDSEDPQTFKGVRGALEKIRSYEKSGYDWSLKADIIDFFPNINVDRLLNDLIYPTLAPDASLNSLIKRAFTQEVKIEEATRKILTAEQLDKFLNNNGLPQGSILSPLFSNVYLSNFDTVLSESGLLVIRYVDDFIIMTKTKKQAEAAYEQAKTELDLLGLKIHEMGHAKTSIQKNNDITFLGIHMKGGDFYPGEEAFQRAIDKLAKYPKYKTLFRNIQSIQMLSQSWASTYYFCNDDKPSYMRLNTALYEAVSKVLYKARLKPVANFSGRELRRLGIHTFDNSIVTFNQRRRKAKR